jgi:iron complex outermembrane receptor protein
LDQFGGVDVRHASLVQRGCRAARCYRSLALSATAGLLALGATQARAQSIEQLQQLSIDQLANIEVTSVSRRPESLSDAAAAIYVITADDIRRSGYARLADVLRLAPNLEVQQQSAQNYAISARGFDSVVAANKLLVMVDGRSIYSPIHSETFWDQLQVPLDDIERIEVISGPGGTQWGPNAVNGVINIITKKSSDTQGGLADLKAGAVDQNGLVQYGGTFGTAGTYRVYGQGLGVGNSVEPNGSSAHDDWHGGQTGFRTDWQSGADTVMFEGDFYRNNDGLDNGRQYGGDLVARWNRKLDGGSSVEVQSSYDEEHRYELGGSDYYAAYDLQAQHTFTLGRNLIVWGGELQELEDKLVQTSTGFQFVPQSRLISIGDGFVQDTITLTDGLKLTLGTKLQYSSYTRLDYLPSIRLGWAVSDNNFLWAAISRAVRTPSRLERDLEEPHILALAPDFGSEKLVAYELGYRTQPAPQLSLSVSLYYNRYTDLRTEDFLPPGSPARIQFGNYQEGDTFGIEAWGDWRALPWWKLSVGVNLMHKDLHITGAPAGVHAVDYAGGDDPGYQVSFRSSMNLPHNVEFDFGIQAVDQLPDPVVAGYVQANARLAWHVTPALELSLSGSNLFAAYHLEAITPGTAPLEIQRSIYLGLRWKY